MPTTTNDRPAPTTGTNDAPGTNSAGRAPAILARVKTALENAGHTQYGSQNVYQAGRFSIPSPGFTLTNATRRGVLVYADTVAGPTATTGETLTVYARAIKNAGLIVRHTTDRHGAICLVAELPASELTAGNDRPLAPAPAPVDIELYRCDLLASLAVELSSAHYHRAQRGEYPTEEGRCDIARRVRTILDAPVAQLNIWRQRGR